MPGETLSQDPGDPEAPEAGNEKERVIDGAERRDMKQPKKLTRDQKKLVKEVGLNPDEWMCHYENNEYLHIVEKAEPAEMKIIDRKRKALC